MQTGLFSISRECPEIFSLFLSSGHVNANTDWDLKNEQTKEISVLVIEGSHDLRSWIATWQCCFNLDLGLTDAGDLCVCCISFGQNIFFPKNSIYIILYICKMCIYIFFSSYVQ